MSSTTAEGKGIHSPDLDEDIGVENMLLGKPSGESQRSFTVWLEQSSKGSNPQAAKTTV